MSGRAGVRWVVSGRVQGVGFRWFVARRAAELALAGWVRNLPNGQVEVVATGDTDPLGRLEEALRTGPRMAHVESVEKSDIPHQAIDAKSFEIR
jgi:acylphosphatase